MTVLCINDSNKPEEIPDHKWLEIGKEYTIIYVAFLHPKMQMAFQLLELDLFGYKYEYFSHDRFIYKSDTYKELVDLVEFSANAQNLIESLKGKTFNVYDFDDTLIESDLDLEKAEILAEMLNDVGDCPPYFIKRTELLT
jgi:hypothetical protein